MKVEFSFRDLLFMTIVICSLFPCSNLSYCDKRILDDDNILSNDEIEILCSRIQTDDRFILNIRRALEIPNIQLLNEHYTNANTEFFSNSCHNLNICENGFLISVFTLMKKIRITSGSEIRKIATDAILIKAVEIMKPFLIKNDFLNAFLEAFSFLKAYKLKKDQNDDHNPDSVEQISNSKSFFFYLVIFIVLGSLCYFLYMLYLKQMEEHELRNTTVTIKTTPKAIYNHIYQLENLIKESQNVSPIIRVDYCLICFNSLSHHDNYNNYSNSQTKGQSTFELRDISYKSKYQTIIDSNDNNYQTRLINNLNNDFSKRENLNLNDNKKFECEHIYHSLCLSLLHINNCLLCSDSNKPSKVLSNKIVNNFNIVNEQQLYNFIRNFKHVYSKKQIMEYINNYPDQFNKFNNIINDNDFF